MCVGRGSADVRAKPTILVSKTAARWHCQTLNIW